MSRRTLAVVLGLAVATTFFALLPSHVEHVHREHTPSPSPPPPTVVDELIATDRAAVPTRAKPSAGGAKRDPADVTPRVEHDGKKGKCTRWELNATTAKVGGIDFVEWCPSAAASCGGSIVRIGVGGTWPTSRALSGNASLSSEIVDRFGPLFFRLRLEGPQALLFNPSPIPSDKSYVAMIPTSLRPGTYRVGLELMYRDYYAADEKTNHWPPMLKAPVLPVDAAFETSYHRQQCTLPSLVDLACESDGDHPEAESEGEKALACDGTGSHTGSWIATPGSVATRVRVRKIQRNPIVFKWAIEREPVDWRFRRDGCRSRRLNFRQLLRGMKGKRVVVGGDSQLRALYYGLVNVLSGNEWPCVRNLSSITAEPSACIQNTKGSQRRTIGGVQVDYVDDLFLEKFMGDRYAGYDVVIVGFGQHPASKEHWTLDRYRGGVYAKAKRVRHLKDQGATVLWYGAPQYPHTTNGYPVVVRDWRTDARLMLFNDAAFAVMRGMDVPVVDSYAVVTAMSHTSPDQAHFSNWVCAELVNVVFDALCGAVPALCADASS